MMLSKVSEYAEKGFQIFFPLFLFFSTIFCGYTRVNNFFHLSALCLLVILISNPILRYQLFNDYKFNIGLFLTILMLSYFCLTNLWSSTFHYSKMLISSCIHAFYLILFLLMFRLIILQGLRVIVLWAMAIGILILVALTFLMVDPQKIFSCRMTDGFFGAPPNVIDLAGYFVLGIFLCLILMRDTGKRWLYIPITILLISLLLTQSRGPLFSLLFVLVILSTLRLKMRESYLLRIFLIGVSVSCLLFMTTHFGDIFFQRLEDVYKASFVRFGIWRHTLQLVSNKPFFGWGLDKQLLFVNLLGDTITTTHSLYLGALLKGGVCGMLLLVILIIYAFILANRQCNGHKNLEGELFLFAAGFYFTQGMFIIDNPTVAWNMFWFPLASVLTLPTVTSLTRHANCSH